MAGPTTEEVLELAGRHYEYLLRTGAQALDQDPLVSSEREVLWPQGAGLAGYRVSVADWHALGTGPVRGLFEEGGFSRAVQRDGFWCLTPVLKVLAAAGRWVTLRTLAGRESTYAHYDPVRGRWLAARWAPGTAEWRARAGLTAEEAAVIARAAHETDMLLDAAATLRDSLPAYRLLARALMHKARASGDPQAVRKMGAVVAPGHYLGGPAGDLLRVSVFGGLQQQSGQLYTELAFPGTAAGALLCPPCEPVDYFSLARAAARPGPHRISRWEATGPEPGL